MTKLEEVARAICCPSGRCTDPERVQKSGLVCESASHMEAARAAVEAMRDYSETMSQIGGAVPKEQFGNNAPIGQSIAERCYLAMIDAVLNEGVVVNGKPGIRLEISPQDAPKIQTITNTNKLVMEVRCCGELVAFVWPGETVHFKHGVKVQASHV